MKGTIFERSTTPLQMGSDAIYLMAATRGSISARQLERELGVTHRTAQRIIYRISSEVMAPAAGALPRRRG